MPLETWAQLKTEAAFNAAQLFRHFRPLKKLTLKPWAAPAHSNAAIKIDWILYYLELSGLSDSPINNRYLFYALAHRLLIGWRMMQLCR